MNMINLYKPLYIGIDSTGTQKNMNYLINEYALKKNFENNVAYAGAPNVAGLDFSGPKKIAYLHAARLLIEAKLMSWPKDIVGIRSQLTNYSYENDKKIAQDIVATMAMSAHAIRMWFHVTPEEILNQINTENYELVGTSRRLDESSRARRSMAARESHYQPY